MRQINSKRFSTDKWNKKIPMLNYVSILGQVHKLPVFSHNVICKEHGEAIHFYRFTICLLRSSGTFDYIDIITSAEVAKNIAEHDLVDVHGVLRSHNPINPETGKYELDVFVFTSDIKIASKPFSSSINTVALDGYVCKPPIIRSTPKGWQIADLFLALNHGNNTSYIPTEISSNVTKTLQLWYSHKG
jgi:hypothetical protein